MNGALVNGYLGNVWKSLPRSNPNRAHAQLVERLVKHPISVFNVDASTALYAFKAAMERGGFTREAINTALETKIRRLPTPGGRLYFSPPNHSGIQLPSMWAGRITSCKPRAAVRHGVHADSARPLDSRCRRRGPRLRGPRRREVVRRRRGRRRRHLRDRARLADVPDRPERRREVDAARLHLRLPPRRRGQRRGRRARRDPLDGAPPRRGGTRHRLPDDAAARQPRRPRERDGRLPPWTRAGFVEGMLRAPWQWREERRIEEEAHDALELVGLADRARVPPASLPARPAAPARGRARARAAAERAAARRAGGRPARRREGAARRDVARARRNAGSRRSSSSTTCSSSARSPTA